MLALVRDNHHDQPCTRVERGSKRERPRSFCQLCSEQCPVHYAVRLQRMRLSVVLHVKFGERDVQFVRGNRGRLLGVKFSRRVPSRTFVCDGLCADNRLWSTGYGWMKRDTLYGQLQWAFRQVYSAEETMGGRSGRILTLYSYSHAQS
jgi:hypothetical protein